MPIEIRELIIRTEVTAGNGRQGSAVQEQELQEIKKQLLEECRHLIQESNRRKSIKR